MDTRDEICNEIVTTENKLNILALQEMIDDIRESTIATGQNSNTTLSAEDLLINEAIVLPSSPEDNISVENTTCQSVNTTSESLVEGLNSTSKLFAIALNRTTTGTNTEPEENTSTTIPANQQLIQSINVTPKKKHIMISYNRSCEEDCRKLRNKLKDSKYKVWMDVYDMPTNFIDGMAKAIRNSYIVLLCINRHYDQSFWCKKEAEDVAIQRIRYIPCFMETPFPLEDWLSFLVGANVWVDFSPEKNFDESFDELARKINIIEGELAISPRETPPTTPMLNPIVVDPVYPNIDQSFDIITRNFKTWVEDNRENLRRLNPNQSSQLIKQLIQTLQTNNNTHDDQIKHELLQQLLSPPSSSFRHHLFRHLNPSDFPVLKSVFLLMALWAVRIVFQKRNF